MERKRAHWPVAGAAMAGVLVIFLSGTVLGCKAGKPSPEQGAATRSPQADSQKGAAIAVAVSNPVRKSVQGELVLNGILHAEDEVQVVAETQGKVTGVYVQVGSRVA